MSKIKTLLADDHTLSHSEPFYYPGEEQAELHEAMRQHELSMFTDLELQEELNRRLMAPLDKAIEDLKATVKQVFGEEAVF